MTVERAEVQRLLREGIEALKHGNRVRGRELLLKVVRQNNGLEDAWWWLSEAVDDPGDKMVALQNVLVLNPGHAEAQKKLTQLRLDRTATAKAHATAAIPTIAGRRVAGEGGADRWKSYLPEVPTEADDGVDDPLQCVYCGLPTHLDSRKCPHCGGSLYRRVSKSTGSGIFRLLLLFVGIAFAIGLVEATGPMFAISAAQTPEKFGFNLLLGFFGVEPFLGNFLKLPPDVATRLLNLHLVRLGVLLGLFFTLRQRWTLAFYAAMVAMVGDVVLSFYWLINNALGIVGCVANLLLALTILSLLAASNYEFAVNTERLVVRPDPKARSALDFYRRGHAYRQRGMWALAVAQWRRAVGLAPKMTQYYKDLGVGYAQLKRFERSLRVLSEARRQAPEDSDIPEMIELVKTKIEENQVPKG